MPIVPAYWREKPNVAKCWKEIPIEVLLSQKALSKRNAFYSKLKKNAYKIDCVNHIVMEYLGLVKPTEPLYFFLKRLLSKTTSRSKQEAIACRMNELSSMFSVYSMLDYYNKITEYEEEAVVPIYSYSGIWCYLIHYNVYVGAVEYFKENIMNKEHSLVCVELDLPFHLWIAKNDDTDKYW